MTGALLLALALAPQATAEGELAAVRTEVSGLRTQVAALHAEMRLRAEAVEALRRDVAAMGEDVTALKDRPALSLAGPFLSAPPPSSDTAGVAKVAVFAPRLRIDAARRHDTLAVRLRRLEPGSARIVADLDLPSDQSSLDLPLDQNGALYVLEWQTSEGHTYALALEDGTSGLPTATVQVKPLQTKGRFLFVGYRVE
jgi:hypothetical protein